MTEFRLSGLLRVRQFEEDRAAAQLAARTIERLEAEDRVSEARRDLAGRGLTGVSDPEAWRRAAACRVAATSALADARALSEERGREQETARGDWSQARMRSTSLGKLADAHTRRETAAEEHREQRTLDEIALRTAPDRREEIA